jgi:hypothetical protein
VKVCIIFFKFYHNFGFYFEVDDDDQSREVVMKKKKKHPTKSSNLSTINQQ